MTETVTVTKNIGEEFEEFSEFDIPAEVEEIDDVAEINFHNITKDDMLNGDGLRVVLWVAGCSHHCKGCHNPITWDADGGIPLTRWEEAEFWTWLSQPWTSGATFSGGDPLHPHNREKIGKMAQEAKRLYPEKTIWVYTGYELVKTDLGYEFRSESGEVFVLPWLNEIDVLVDGKFEADTRCKDIEQNKRVCWRGSSNQRVIDIQQTLTEGHIVVR